MSTSSPDISNLKGNASCHCSNENFRTGHDGIVWNSQVPKKIENPCPDCGAELESRFYQGGGVTCSECSYWFCY